jgi:hypothetical protein
VSVWLCKQKLRSTERHIQKAENCTAEGEEANKCMATQRSERRARIAAEENTLSRLCRSNRSAARGKQVCEALGGTLTAGGGGVCVTASPLPSVAPSGGTLLLGGSPHGEVVDNNDNDNAGDAAAGERYTSRGTCRRRARVMAEVMSN